MKQAHAPAFSFLQPGDALHAYYCHLRDEEREPGEDYTMDEAAKARAQGQWDCWMDGFVRGVGQ